MFRLLMPLAAFAIVIQGTIEFRKGNSELAVLLMIWSVVITIHVNVSRISARLPRRTQEEIDLDEQYGYPLDSFGKDWRK